MIAFALITIVGYLLGSIPFGYILIRVFRGADIRKSGSGNIGATNVARSSPALGILTLALDALKGLLAVGLSLLLFPGQNVLAESAALAAMLGHMFPIWLDFHGGKGVATGLGAFVLLAPKAILLTIAVFVVVAAATRYISLASIVSAAALPFLVWVLGSPRGAPLIVCGAAGALLIIVRHHANIGRLFSRQEPRLQWRRQ